MTQELTKATREGAGEWTALPGRPRGRPDPLSIDITPSHQGPAPDMSSASAPPTLTALVPQGSDSDARASRSPGLGVDTLVDIN
jgi:hypothetical protein